MELSALFSHSTPLLIDDIRASLSACRVHIGADALARKNADVLYLISAVELLSGSTSTVDQNVLGVTVIHAEAEVLVSRTISDVYSALVDFGNYSKWMEACVRLSQTSAGALRCGAPLHYVHNTAGKKGEMSGVVTTLEQNRALKLKFEDSLFTIALGFSTDAVKDGTRVTHFIDIDPKSFFGRLFTPVIKKGNAKQVAANLKRFKNLLESS